jgi:hypothetical protein
VDLSNNLTPPAALVTLVRAARRPLRNKASELSNRRIGISDIERTSRPLERAALASHAVNQRASEFQRVP